MQKKRNRDVVKDHAKEHANVLMDLASEDSSVESVDLPEVAANVQPMIVKIKAVRPPPSFGRKKQTVQPTQTAPKPQNPMFAPPIVTARNVSSQPPEMVQPVRVDTITGDGAGDGVTTGNGSTSVSSATGVTSVSTANSESNANESSESVQQLQQQMQQVYGVVDILKKAFNQRQEAMMQAFSKVQAKFGDIEQRIYSENTQLRADTTVLKEQMAELEKQVQELRAPESKMIAQTLQSPTFFGPGDDFINFDEFGLDDEIF